MDFHEIAFKYLLVLLPLSPIIRVHTCLLLFILDVVRLLAPSKNGHFA
jgi:hypothetical protein